MDEFDAVMNAHRESEAEFASRSEIRRMEGQRSHQGQLGPWGAQTNLHPGVTDETFELRWPNSLNVYDKMRKTSSTVHAVFRAATLPIRRTPWRLEQGQSRDVVAQLVADTLGLPIAGRPEEPLPRLSNRFAWKDHLRLALLKLIFGHMPFEKIWALDADGYLVLKTLSPIMPTTIEEIVVNREGELERIVQFPWEEPARPTWEGVKIERRDLVFYVNDREGGNWTGTSILRSAYKHWMLQDRLYRVQAMTIERNGMGVPIFVAPPGASESDIAKGHELAMKYRAGEASGGAIPFGSDLRLKGVEGSLPDAMPVIEHHDTSIARNILAQYLMLGDTDTGSRALGEAFVDDFTESTQAVLEDLAEEMQVQIVEDIVTQNFGEAEPAPILTPAEVGAEQAITADALTQLINAGAVTPDDDLEMFLRRSYRLPKSTVDRKTDSPDERTPDRQRRRPEPGDNLPTAMSASWFSKTGRREPTEWEKRVDFQKLQTDWELAVESVIAAYLVARERQLDELTTLIASAVNGKDLVTLGNLSVPRDDAAHTKLRREMNRLAQQAADQAVSEIDGVERQVANMSGLIESRAQAVDDLVNKALAEVAGRRSLMEAGPDVSGEEVARRVRTHIESLKSGYLKDQLGGALTAAQNTGRLMAFSAAGDKIRRIYASELLDTETCEPCDRIDGKEYTSLMAAELDYPTGGYHRCAGGPRCRGTLVAVYDEADPNVRT